MTRFALFLLLVAASGAGASGNAPLRWRTDIHSDHRQRGDPKLNTDPELWRLDSAGHRRRLDDRRLDDPRLTEPRLAAFHL